MPTAARMALVLDDDSFVEADASLESSDPLDFRIDRRTLKVTTFSEDARTNRSLKYWRSRPPSERVAAVEFLRRQVDVSGARLRRVLRVTARPPR